MNFAEKLTFLINITSTSNKQLAIVAHVDPSLISMLRSGKRQVPKNNKYMDAVATYFSKKCVGNYQRIALSEALNRKYLPVQMDTEQLSAILFDWLTDSRDEVGQFLNTFEQFSFEEVKERKTVATKPDSLSRSLNYSYFGDEGKRGAINTFLDILQAQDKPGTVLLSTDENLDWLYEGDYHAQLMSQMLSLVKKGFRICYIAAPIQTAEQGFDTLSRWLPLHLTGQIDAYYYPRLRDVLYHRTMIILPGVASVLSSSIGNQTKNRYTLLSQDSRMLECFAGDFHDLLSRCKPMITTHSSEGNAEDLLRCISQFESDRGNRIQQSTTLSSITAPLSLIQEVASNAPSQDTSAIIQTLSNAQERFVHSLADFEFIDIHSLASIEDIKEGKVPVGCEYLCQVPPIHYTPKTYIAHLQSIIYYIENYPNYHSVFRDRGPDIHAILVKEGRQVILMRPGTPLTVFEISQPYVAESCREYLLQFSKPPYSKCHGYSERLAMLKSMIQELENL